MPANDTFGGKREAIIARSRVRQIFTPSQPVTTVDLLKGRDSHVVRLVEILNTPGQHALLYGDRGVGKSSLATVISIWMELNDHFKKNRIFFKTCCSDDTFETIFKDPLKNVGIDTSISESSTSLKQKSAAKVSALVANADLESVRESTQKSKVNLTVSSVAEALRSAPGLLVIDEADAISGDAEKKKIAELIKLLSDARSGFKIMVVGIASTGSELIAGHKSVERCLGQVKLERLTEIELWKIIKEGQAKIVGHRIEFDFEVVNSIAAISNGYPYFTHLLALKCAEEAIVGGTTTIRRDDLTAATRIAADAAEASLHNGYYSAIRSSSADGDLYRQILLAAAKVPKHEFTARELREKVCEISGRQLSQAKLGRYYSSLISDGSGTILRRVEKGIYCFNDPRFPSFIRMANADV